VFALDRRLERGGSYKKEEILIKRTKEKVRSSSPEKPIWTGCTRRGRRYGQTINRAEKKEGSIPQLGRSLPLNSDSQWSVVTDCKGGQSRTRGTISRKKHEGTALEHPLLL